MLHEPDWHAEHGQTYKEYLQTSDITKGVQSATREMIVAIPREIARIIGTPREISERGYRSTAMDRSVADGLHGVSEDLRDNAERMSRGLRRVSEDIQDLEDTVGAVGERLDETFRRRIGSLQKTVATGFADIAVVFHWGVQELVKRAEQQLASLDEIRKGQRHRVREGAIEQWEMALTHMRVGDYQRAHDRLRRALAKDDTNSRFYFQLGLLHLGSFENADPEVVNPADAERAFNEAVKYATAEGDSHAVAFAHFYAARAAYLQGRAAYPRAVEHLKLCIAAFPEVWEAWFQLGNILLLMDRIDEGIAHLRVAVEQDATYAMKAFELNGYMRHQKAVKGLFELLRGEWRHQLQLAFARQYREAQDWLERFPRLAGVPRIAALLMLFEKPKGLTLMFLQDAIRKQQKHAAEFAQMFGMLATLVRDVHAAFEEIAPAFRYYPELCDHEVVVRWRQILQSSDVWTWLELVRYAQRGFAQDLSTIREIRAEQNRQIAAAVRRIGGELVAVWRAWDRELDEAVDRLSREIIAVADIIHKRREINRLRNLHRKVVRLLRRLECIAQTEATSAEFQEWRAHTMVHFPHWREGLEKFLSFGTLESMHDEMIRAVEEFRKMVQSLRDRSRELRQEDYRQRWAIRHDQKQERILMRRWRERLFAAIARAFGTTTVGAAVLGVLGGTVQQISFAPDVTTVFGYYFKNSTAAIGLYLAFSVALTGVLFESFWSLTAGVLAGIGLISLAFPAAALEQWYVLWSWHLYWVFWLNVPTAAVFSLPVLATTLWYYIDQEWPDRCNFVRTRARRRECEQHFQGFHEREHSELPRIERDQRVLEELDPIF